MILTALSPILCIPGLIYLLIMKCRGKKVKEDTKDNIICYAILGAIGWMIFIAGRIADVVNPPNENTNYSSSYSDDWRDPGDEWEPDAFGRWGED